MIAKMGNGLGAVRYRDLDDVQRMKLAEIIAEENLSGLNMQRGKVYPPNSFYVKYGKRMIDVIVSFSALIIFAPVNLILLIAAFLDVGRPVIFAQERTGKDGKTFKLYKFRNMTNETDENGTLLPPEERVTRWGRFVRKTSLDELLNFVHIFAGNMSVIGPRPMPEEYRKRMTQYHDSRHTVRPGLECPLHDGSMGDMTWGSRFDNDVWYVQNISLKTDVAMIWLLVKDALWGARREKRATGDAGDFVGYDSDGSIIDSHYIPQKYMERLLESGGEEVEKKCFDISGEFVLRRRSIRMPERQSAV